MSARKTSSRNKTRIFIVDDHPMMRDGLRALINAEPDLAVCGEADDGLKALDAVAQARPDLVLADITLPGKSGLELIKDWQAMRPELPVLVISMHDEGLYAERVLRAGGRGYVMKQVGGHKLLEAIRTVLAGKVYVSERMSERILQSFSDRKRGGQGPVAKLSDREFEVFQLIGEGIGTADIAARLHLSVKTVEAHRANIKQKLGLKGATELVREAVRWVEMERGGR